MSLAIWSKKLEAERAAFSALEMRNCCMVRWEGNDPEPGALVLMVAAGALEPECFLAARANSGTAIPKIIELIHSMGNYEVALGQC
jgi:hypothetical protein